MLKNDVPEIIADLEALTDDELRATITASNRLLDERDKKRKQEALDRARAILAEAGLPFPENGRGKYLRKGAAK